MIVTNPAGVIELAVICNVCNGSAAAIEFINSVIDKAVSDRKGVRPTHPGTLIQAGYDAGPHHLCVWGFVQNLKSKKWSQDEKYAKGHQILGATALAGIFLGLMHQKRSLMHWILIYKRLESLQWQLKDKKHWQDVDMGI
ncbi:hypothetical protein JB92DRAFT_2835993 [Gautieria morchelliformis]|nr:hypothetical protein JB92DRAFT_2835993 [Gautieria morchelliformis]